MSNTPKRLARLLARLAVAVALVVPSVIVAAGSASVAAPTQAEVEAAQAEAEAIGNDLEVAIERYNDARVRLNGVQDKLAAALDDKETAEAVAAEATGQLEDRAVQAYTGAGSQIDVLLGASDLAEFSDRLEFMGALAQNDADLANTAENAQQQAEWAAARYADTIGDKQAELDQMESARAEIERMLTQQKALVDQLDREYREYIERQEAAAAAAAAAELEAASDTTSGGGDTTGGGGGFVPPPNASAAQIAIGAADSVVGAPYVWGTAGPDTFDCSGLTSWAYAQAGVYLPHSSAAQASAGVVVPSLSEALPGDLLFFYSPISHVALFVGGGSMIHARHPGPGGEVQYGSVSGYGTPVVLIVRPT